MSFRATDSDSSGAAIRTTDVVRVRDESVQGYDHIAVEEPLEIQIGFSDGTERKHRSISVTMRTPGRDFELAAGFLFTEGVISGADDIQAIDYCAPSSKEGFRNTVRVDLRPGVEIDFSRLQRHFYTSSSCGVCGKSSIEAVGAGRPILRPSPGPALEPSVVHSLPQTIRAAQPIFESTGGLHASALFTAQGEPVLICEDVGRHNALDKVIGTMLLENRLPLEGHLLLVSGRVSFELVQKALMAGIPALAAVGAPSTLAVELARKYGMTLLGFVRDGRFNVYSGDERIIAG